MTVQIPLNQKHGPLTSPIAKGGAIIHQGWQYPRAIIDALSPSDLGAPHCETPNTSR